MRRNALLAVTLLTLLPSLPANSYGFDVFAQVTPGIYRGSQPNDSVDFQTLQTNQIHSIVSLRGDDDSFGQESGLATQFKMIDVNYPLDALQTPDENEVAQILKYIASESNQPVFVHCERGIDRTGLIIALYRVHKMGWDPQKAYDEWENNGFIPVLFPLTDFYWSHVSVETGAWPGPL